AANGYTVLLDAALLRKSIEHWEVASTVLTLTHLESGGAPRLELRLARALQDLSPIRRVVLIPFSTSLVVRLAPVLLLL
ncbi:hypothetical protein, partial [Burkholderia sp. SIMBA_024]|uniref:hypothetical protein n=1 Tax=Burkholderia sp. SIMBA_024 TaxID=3085768 RepID=UPI00397E7198